MYRLYFTVLVILLHNIKYGLFIPLSPEQEEIHSLIAEHVINQANIPVSFRMEKPTTPFIGRVSEISEIKWSHIDKKIVVVTGVRGVGKSELAKKYAQDFKLDNVSSTIWINSESHLSVRDAFRDLAITVGININNKDASSVIKAVIDHFNNRRTLFIFDNSEDDNIIVNNLPLWIGKSRFISVIVTSRSENWDQNKFRFIKLNPFTLDEAKEFIKTAISKEITLAVDDESCTKLAELLHYIPLALSGAVKDIIKQNSLNPNKVYTIINFIESFNERPVEIVTIAEVRPPTGKEIEDAIQEKLKEETKRIGDQVSDEAKRFGKRVENEARRVRDRVKKWFG